MITWCWLSPSLSCVVIIILDCWCLGNDATLYSWANNTLYMAPSSLERGHGYNCKFQTFTLYQQNLLKPANSILTCFSAQHSPAAMNNWQTSPFMKTRELVYKETKLSSYSTFMHSLSLVWSCGNYAKLKGVVIDEFKCGRQYCQSYALKRMECWRLFSLHVLVETSLMI